MGAKENFKTKNHKYHTKHKRTLPRSIERGGERRIQERFQNSQSAPHQEIQRPIRQRNWVASMYSGSLYGGVGRHWLSGGDTIATAGAGE